MAFDEFTRAQNMSQKIGLPGLNETTQDQVFFISFGQAWCTKQLSRYRQLQLDQGKKHSRENLHSIIAITFCTPTDKFFQTHTRQSDFAF